MLKKYANFWNIYLIIIFMTFILFPMMFFLIYITLGILLLSDRLFKSIKNKHIIILFIYFSIAAPLLFCALGFIKGVILLSIQIGFAMVFAIFAILGFASVLALLPIIIIIVINVIISEDPNKKIPLVILLTLYFIFALPSVFSDYISNLLGPEDEFGIVIFFFFGVFLLSMLSSFIFFEKNKVLKYLVIVFLISTEFIMFPIFTGSTNFLTPFIKENFYLYTIASIFIILYILTLLDIVFGKFFTKLNDYATKLVGISAIGYSIFMLVYILTPK